tara:strand:+ start:1041 stop:2078 length:1038 start_codon:yes stop_codon:yes gene_type:complete
MKKILKHFFVLFICTYIYSVDEELILSQEFPDKLSDFRFFKDASAQVPHDKVIPYELISTLFSDYSYKQRWVYVPNEKKAEYQEDWVFDFPTGSALIKTFYYPIDERNPELGKNLLETRLLLKKDQGWEAVSYAWNKEQNEAFKKIAGKTINVSWTDFMGEERDVRYRVPNVNQCKECHDADDKISPIGPKARNINKDFAFKEGTFNQLTYWMNRQIIDEYPLDLVSPVDWTDESKDINDRVRSYLDVNCGHCHSPTGNANSTGLYLHLNETRNINLGVFKKPVATGRGSGGLKYSIVPGEPEESILLHRMISMDPGVMMPESGRALTHTEAVEMVRDWILLMED